MALNMQKVGEQSARAVKNRLKRYAKEKTKSIILFIFNKSLLKGALRMAVRFQSKFFDGMQENW
jgi:hypothetical protein